MNIKKAGFSLVEMSVALAAVAAVVVVTVGGSSMVQRTKLGSIITDIENFSKASIAFEQKYKSIPGDLASTGGLTGATAGNGNGTIDTAAEALQVWQHLSLAGLIKGKFNGTSTYVPGTGVPAGSIKSSGYNVLIPTVVDAKLSQALIIEFAGFTSSSNSQPILTPDDAKAIDEKIDDGLPNTGTVRGINAAGNNGSNTECATSAAANATYNVNSKNLGCRVRFIINTSSQADDAVTLGGGCTQAGMTRVSDAVGDVCPPGTIGRVIKTCRINTTTNQGSWETTSSHCQAITCQGGKKYGEKRMLPCMNGQVGTGVTQTCSGEGVWVTGGASNASPPFNTPNADGIDCVLPDDSVACSPNGTVRAPQACNWSQTGSVNQTCASATWNTTNGDPNGTCSLITCSGGTVGGTKAGSACSGNYSGTTTETCVMDGTWKVTSNKCLPIIKTGACTVGVTADADLGCPPGEVGSNIQRCVANATWAPVGSTCKPITCSGERVGTARVVKGAACPSGRSGVVVEVCHTDGTWVQTLNHCATNMCRGNSDQAGNAIWPYAAVSTNGVVGTCIGGYTGSPTRNCDSSGNWVAPSVSCTRSLCTTPSDNANWINPYSKTADVKGVCIWPDYEGNPTRDCDLTGAGTDWSSASKSPCVATALPYKTGLQLWLDAADYSSLFSDTGCTAAVAPDGAVGCWKDKSGNVGGDAIAGNAPTYTTNAMNSKPVLRFNGTSNYLMSTLNSNITTTTLTYFVVAKRTAVSSFTTTLSGVAPGVSDNDSASSFIGAYESDGSTFTGYRNPGYVSTIAHVGNSVPYILTGKFDGTNHKIYSNGTAGTTVASSGAFNINKFYVGSRFQALTPIYFVNGDIAEILVYNTALSDSDRNAVTTYLGTKWNISVATLPVSGPKLWLDSSDSNTMLLTNCSGSVAGVGGAISCWKDKSGGGFHLSAASTEEPQLASDGVSNAPHFDGSNDTLIGAFTGTVGNNTTFVVAKLDTLTPTEAGPGLVTTQNADGSVFDSIVYNENTPTIWRNGSNNSARSLIASSYPEASTGRLIMDITRAAGKYAIFRNGLMIGDAVLSPPSFNTGKFALGLRHIPAGVNGNFDGYIYETIIYASALSDVDRMAVEQYLGDKWSVTVQSYGALPVTTGIQLWLDADDISTLWQTSDCTTTAVSAAAQAVACWKDKSGIGRNATKASNNPAYTTGGMNGKPSLTFDGVNDSLTISEFTLPTTATGLVVYHAATTSSAGQLISTTSNSGGRYQFMRLQSPTQFSTWNGAGYGSTAFTASTLSRIVTFKQSAASAVFYLNGAAFTGGTVNNEAYKVSQIGALDVNNQAPFPGDISEVLIYNSALSDTNRNLVENYLNDKWSINALPTSTNLQLWLDANQINTLYTNADCSTGANPANGASINCWKDRSVNARNVITGAFAYSPVAPIYATNTINTLPAMNFPGNSGMKFATDPGTIIANGADRTVFAVILPTVNILNSELIGTSTGTMVDFGNVTGYDNRLQLRDETNCPGCVNNKTVAGTVMYGTSSVISYRTTSTSTQAWNKGINILNSSSLLSHWAIDGTMLVGSANYNGRQYNGKLGELLIYSGALDNATRNSVEQYLGKKWNIPVADASAPPVTNSLRVWLDAADSGTTLITSCTGASATSGQNIACVKDKSGNGINATIGVAPTYALNSMNSLPAMHFTGSSGLSLGSATTVGIINSAYEVFIVAKAVSSNVEFLMAGCCSTTERYEMHINGSVGLRFIPDAGLYADVGADGQYINNGPHIFSARVGNDGSETSYSRVDTIDTSVPRTTGKTSDNQSIILGSRGNSTYYFTGDMGEVLIYNTELSGANRASIESYLAAKWGVSIPDFSDLPVQTGVKLWLDANDTSTLYQNSNCTSSPVTTTGQSVACWKDKSGQHNATAGTAPTYVTNVFNGGTMPVVRGGAGKYLNNSFTYGSQLSMFIVATPAVSTQRYLMGGNGPGSSPSIINYIANYEFYGSAPRFTINQSATGSNIISVVHTDGGTTYGYFNGVETGNGTGLTLSGRVNNVLFAASAGVGDFDGDIAEILMYNTALNATNRAATETYLSNKWGVTLTDLSDLPVQSGVKLWLDANDTSTMLKTNCSGAVAGNNEAISCWKDKSGQGANLSAASTEEPLFASDGTSNAPHFDGSNDTLIGSYIGAVGNNTTFVVAKLDTLTPAENGPGLVTIQTSDGGTFDSIVYNEYTALRWMNGSEGFARTPNTVSAANETSTSRLIIDITRQGSLYNLYRNGTQISSTTSYSPPSISTGKFALGLRHIPAGGNGNFDGYIYETIIYNTALSNTNRNAVEVYLGNKWGITVIDLSDLPTADGLKLWLDANDSSTITQSGTFVSQWNDKSGNGNNMVQAGADTLKPKTTTRTQNGKNVLDFDGGDHMTRTFTADMTQPSTVILVGAMDAVVGYYFYDGIEASKRFLIDVQGGPLQFMAYAGADFYAGGTQDTGSHIHTVTFNTGSSSYHIDGALRNSGNIGTHTLSGLTLGARYTLDQNLDGYIAEMLIYSGALNTTDRAAVETYLGAKWGITVP